ncbi:DsbA family protein [Sandaracinobacteroides hominis]|uniref:DsbA family protein n=1 Tax=Sandaracinobacteroides hominis TaxID=2780086 RepID=UPI0018F3B611|nr:DsbA family protein [Sandaracinobacteroides hominis]
MDDVEGPAETPQEQKPGFADRLRQALGGSSAHWGWWAAGLAVGVLGAMLAMRFVTPAEATLPTGERAAMEKLVKDTILDNPEIIPQAIDRLQTREVEKLLASNREAIETPFAGAWAGNPDGDVVLVEFFDFNCPYCRQSSGDVERLLKEDPNLKLVFRDMPVLGPDSERFALAALSAAQQGRYAAFYRNVFAGQGALSQERLIRNTRAAGLDEAKVAAALSSKELQAEVEKNVSLGRALGLTGTPSYVVGNKILSGAVGYEALKEAVEAARKKS